MKKKLILWFISTKLYDFIVLKIMPFVRFSVNHTKFRGHKYHDGYQYLKPGRILGSIDYNKATGKIIPKVTGGILSHAGYCIDKRDPANPNSAYSRIMPIEGQGKGLEVVEMTHLDFTFSDFYDFCHESERVIIFECIDWDAEYVNRLNKAALDFKISKYETGFSLDHPGYLYCSGLIYEMDLAAGGGIQGRLKCDLSDLMGLGRPYISPDGLLCSENVIVIWDSENELTGLTGPEVEKIIFNKKRGQ